MGNVWQIATGGKEKDLIPTMIEEGLMMIGPGDNVYISSTNDVSSTNDMKYKSDIKILKSFCESKKGEIVVLRLGSVCFAVGAIDSPYERNDKFAKVKSYWNRTGSYDPNEQPWDLQHTKKVIWFILKDKEALFNFRRGIYAKKRFCRVGDDRLHSYLKKLDYNGTNGQDILSKIGDQTSSVNEYGFPSAK